MRWLLPQGYRRQLVFFNSLSVLAVFFYYNACYTLLTVAHSLMEGALLYIIRFIESTHVHVVAHPVTRQGLKQAKAKGVRDSAFTT